MLAVVGGGRERWHDGVASLGGTMKQTLVSLMQAKWIGLALAVLVLLGAGFALGVVVPHSSATPAIETGTVRLVSGDGSEFLVQLDGSRVTKSYALDPLLWYSPASNSWTSGSRPSCMAPLSHGQHITFGVVWANPTGDAPGGPAVIWLEC